MRQPMSWTRDQMKELRSRIDEVEDLGDEEKEERLAEVAEDADDSENHACEVTVGVADKDTCRVPVVSEKGKRDAEEGEEEVEGEEMRVCCWMGERQT